MQDFSARHWTKIRDLQCEHSQGLTVGAEIPSEEVPYRLRKCAERHCATEPSADDAQGETSQAKPAGPAEWTASRAYSRTERRRIGKVWRVSSIGMGSPAA